MDENINFDITLKTDNEIEEQVGKLIKDIRTADWFATLNSNEIKHKEEIAYSVRERVIEKRKLKNSRWQIDKKRIKEN